MERNVNYILSDNPESFIQNESHKNNNFTLYRYSYVNINESAQMGFNKLFNPIFNDIQKINMETFNEIWSALDSSSYIIRDDFSLKKHYQKNNIELSYNDLFYAELIVSYLTSPDYCNYLVPVTRKFLDDTNPIDIYNLAIRLQKHSKKNIYFITDSAEWVNIYIPNPFQYNIEKGWINTECKPQEFFWVEGEFDKFTFEIFMPGNTFLIGGSCSKIFSILNKNPDHKAIIDRDGYSSKTMAFFREKYNIYCTSTVECENLWLKEDIYNRIKSINSHSIDFTKFKENVISRACDNFDNIFNRLENRQKYLEYHLIPYLDKIELEKLKNKFQDNIRNNNYEKILDWFDNKSLFELYIKEMGFRNTKDFQKEMIKNKAIFHDIDEKTLIK